MTNESDAVKKALADLGAEMDAKMSDALLGGMYTESNEELTPLKLDQMVHTWKVLKRSIDRATVTLRVDLAHEGPMISFEGPDGGKIVECSWRDANHVHQHWPFKLVKVHSEHCADFQPLSWPGEFAPKILPMPPYDIPDEEDPPPLDGGGAG